MSTTTLAQEARRAAQAFRLGMEGAAGSAIQALVDGLAVELRRRPERVAHVQPLLAELLAAQARRDPIGAADVLEHDLAPLLDGRARKERAPPGEAPGGAPRGQA